MILHNNSSFLIYFGDSRNCCAKFNKKISLESIKSIQKILPFQKIVFLNQVHGSDGRVIKNFDKINSSCSLFERDGDYLITNLRNLGIGVISADCLPVIFYDSVNSVASVAHVGWRGAVLKITSVIIDKMQQEFNSKKENLIIYFGPCARVCCYQIGDDFLKNLEGFAFRDQVLIRRNEKHYFDLPKFVKLQLLELDIKVDKIRQNYNDCTICNPEFCSVRRQGETSSRQATIVVLK